MVYLLLDDFPPSDVYSVTLSDYEGKELRRREENREFTDFSGPDLKLDTRYFVTVGQVVVSIFVTGSHLPHCISFFKLIWIPLIFHISLTKMPHCPRILLYQLNYSMKVEQKRRFNCNILRRHAFRCVPVRAETHRKSIITSLLNVSSHPSAMKKLHIPLLRVKLNINVLLFYITWTELLFCWERNYLCLTCQRNVYIYLNIDI